jgi:predicted phosphodiesterase
MTDQQSLARLKELYDGNISHDEIANDPELRADLLSGLDNDTARRTQLGKIIEHLAKTGYLTRRSRAEQPRHAATTTGQGTQNQTQIPERRRSAYDRSLERYEQFIGASARRREWKPMPITGRRETVIFSDTHIPDERPDLIAEVCARHKGARLVIAGDINDFQKYSRYEVEELGLPNMRDAFAQTDAFLEQMTEFFPETVVMFGNHDLRLERKVRRLLGEEFAWMTAEFHRMAYEKRHGIKVVSHHVERISGRPIEGLHYWYQIGDCLISHAERGGKAHGKGATDAHDFFYSHWKAGFLPLQEFKILLQAHTHKRCWVQHPTTHVHCVEIGAMCDVQAYSLKNPRYAAIQNGYFHLVQHDGVTDVNESRLWILE